MNLRGKLNTEYVSHSHLPVREAAHRFITHFCLSPWERWHADSLHIFASPLGRGGTPKGVTERVFAEYTLSVSFADSSPAILRIARRESHICTKIRGKMIQSADFVVINCRR